MLKKWFVDRDLENGGRLDKQSLKLSEEFGDVMRWLSQEKRESDKDSIGDCQSLLSV